MRDLFIAGGACLITIASNILWFLIVIRKDKIILEMSRLLASRSFSDYSIGAARLAGTQKKKPEKENGETYESIWENRDEG